MSSIIRNLLAIVVGLFVGGVINMGFVSLGPTFFPFPDGTDITTMEGLKASMTQMEPVHFLFPYLGHALGTLVGAYTAARIAVSKNMLFALLIGAIFLAGGIRMIQLVGGPTWFCALDLLSYLPMGYLGGKMALKVINKF